MVKKVIVVLFGGQSSEHEVSCMSAANVIDQIDREKYEVIMIGITKEGHWIKTEDVEMIRSGEWLEGKCRAVISPDATARSILLIENKSVEEVKVDAVFPVLHGKYGEDGTVQGLLELARIPYVGCGVLASAVAMDKLYTKIIVNNIGIKQAEFVPVFREELSDIEPVIKKIEERFSYPVFIKPSNAGSSRGVSKAETRDELVKGLNDAVQHDGKILVEEMIEGREIECAVFGGGKTEVTASGVGEILAAAEFYDYDAKYCNAESKTVVNPQLPQNAAEEVRRAAAAIFKAIDGYGLSRVDFFVKSNGEVVFNEINTMPGFTAISMYPMLWEAEGISKGELIEKLIKHAFQRYE